jgi:hypothetical protein
MAVEAETGKYRHSRERVYNKVQLLKKNYDNWLFVVTNRNMASKYRFYGKVFEKRYVKNGRGTTGQ